LSLSFKTSKRIAGLFYLTYILFNFQRPFSSSLSSDFIILSFVFLFVNNFFSKVFLTYFVACFSDMFYNTI